VEDPPAPFLLGLDLLPAQPDRACAGRLGVAEDVRVPADELLVDPARDGLQPAVSLLGEEQGEEVDLEEQVAELVPELPGRAGDGGIGDLVCLLDRVRDDRPGRLLPVPGAIAAQPLGEALELEESLREALLRGLVYRSSVPESSSSGSSSEPVSVSLSAGGA
jgi:hypothetical protein